MTYAPIKCYAVWIAKWIITMCQRKNYSKKGKYLVLKVSGCMLFRYIGFPFNSKWTRRSALTFARLPQAAEAVFAQLVFLLNDSLRVTRKKINALKLTSTERIKCV